jgi:U3 small nucleolar ribonucleoprotein protein IMP4
LAVPELRLVFPNAERFNRGQTGVAELVEACRAAECTDLVVVHETRGEPDAMLISHMPYGPTACFGLVNVVTRHDVEETAHAPQALPHLIFDKFDSTLGERVKSILKYLFPVPKTESTRVITFANRSDYISFRHHSFQLQPPADPLLKEIGPRFEMRLYQIRLGTLEQEHADTEFNLRPFVRKRGSYLEK